jgi:hypothetical protein
MTCLPSTGRWRSTHDRGQVGCAGSNAHINFVRADWHTHLMTPGRLEYVQPFGVRRLANTEGRRGTQREIATAKKQAADALERGRRRAEELRRNHES